MLQYAKNDIRGIILIHLVKEQYHRMCIRTVYGLPNFYDIYFAVKNNFLSTLVTDRLSHDDFEFFDCYSYDCVVQKAKRSQLDFLLPALGEIETILRVNELPVILNDAKTNTTYVRQTPLKGCW